MGDVNVFVTNGVQHAKRAITADRHACEHNDPAKYEEALNGYVSAIEYYRTAMKYEKNTRTKEALKVKVGEYITRAEVMKEWLDKYEEKGRPPIKASGGPKKKKKGKGKSPEGGGDADGDEVDEEDKKMRSALSSAIVSEKPNVKWDDVAGLESAKAALQEAVILPMKYPSIFTGNRKPWRGILMYGPPGTGKSYLAKAVATEADAQFFSVSSADLVSKWQGESEKLVRELFKMAREAKSAIIFIDEIDSLASARSDSESESARRIKTEFLVQMQGVGNEPDGVLVLGATNIPWGLDSAIRRRFERRIYIPLPDSRARSRMFDIHLGSTQHTLTRTDFDALAEKSDGYSGSDINVVVRDAIMQPVRTLQNAQYFKKVVARDANGKSSEKYTPCSPGDPEAQEMKLMSIPGDKLHVPPVTMFDFEKALTSSNSSVSHDDLKKHEDFTKEFGSGS